MPFDWRTATDEEVEHQYSPSRHALRPLDEYFVQYRERSARWVGAPTVVPGRPLLVYIHGGYWQRLSAADSLFNGDDAAAHGVSLHAVEYTLAPSATVEQIVEECIDDVERVIAGAAAPRVAVAGCSAGAHLAAMCAMSPRLSGLIDVAVLLSGIYDLRPVVRISDNAALCLDAERAAALSPQLLPLSRFARHAVVAAGGHDPAEFVRQSAEFAARLADLDVPTVNLVVPERDHFDLPYDILRQGTALGDHVLRRLLG